MSVGVTFGIRIVLPPIVFLARRLEIVVQIQ